MHTLNWKTGNRVQAQYVDTETGKPIDDVDQVKGYERSEGDYVMLENEKLDAVALDSTSIIGTGSFRVLPAAACRDNQRLFADWLTSEDWAPGARDQALTPGGDAWNK